MALNLDTLEEDVAALLTRLPGIEGDLKDLAFVLSLIPSAQPLAAGIAPIIGAIAAIQVVSGDIPAFLAAGQKIKADFQAALAAKTSQV